MTNYKRITIMAVMLGLTFWLGGCQARLNEAENEAESLSYLGADSVLLYQDKRLVNINTVTGLETASYPIPDEFLPVSFEYERTFKASADGSLVVWFVPAKGLVSWSLPKRTVKVVYEPTDWFYENPYFKFFGKTHDLMLVDKRGTEVVRLNLDDESYTTQAIPYPFGTIFKLSPDLTKILYIEGYQQTAGSPRYLITTLEGEEVARIRTNAEVADRAMVGWTEDSRQIITIENQDEIAAYTVEASSKRSVLYTLAENERVVELSQQGRWLFIGSRAYWYLFDTREMKLVRRLPVEAMSQLNRPKFVFAKDSAEKFFVEENIRSFETVHKRLWESDWSGEKRIVVPQYGVTTTQPVIF
jgi:hypothetical protein